MAGMSERITDLVQRPRRLRMNPQLRRMVQRVHLRRSDFILPVFVTEGEGVRRDIPSMPGVQQLSVDTAMQWLSAEALVGLFA